MANTTDATNKVNALQLDRTIAKLNTKLARQLEAVKETEAHIAAIKMLIASQPK